MCVSDTLFALNRRQASKQQNVPTLSLDKTKASVEGKTGGEVVVVLVTGCGKASGGFHHVWKEMRMRMRMYAREHDFSNKCRAFNGLRVCVRKDMSLLLLLLLLEYIP